MAASHSQSANTDDIPLPPSPSPSPNRSLSLNLSLSRSLDEDEGSLALDLPCLTSPLPDVPPLDFSPDSPASQDSSDYSDHLLNRSSSDSLSIYPHLCERYYDNLIGDFDEHGAEAQPHTLEGFLTGFAIDFKSQPSMAATISPKDLHRDSELDSPEPSIYDETDGDQYDTTGYACLRFPDTDYFLKETSIIIGRDVDLQERLAHCKTLRVNGETVRLPQADTPSTSGSCDESDSESSDEYTVDDPVQASQVGGVLGMRARGEIVPTIWCDGSEEVLLPIHPPLDRSGQFNFNTISKGHVRIRLEDDDTWRATAVGRNGFFLDGELVPYKNTVTLENEARLQVAGLEFFFITHGDNESDSETEESSGDDSGGQEISAVSKTAQDDDKKAKGQAANSTKIKLPKTDAKAKAVLANGKPRKRAEQDPRELLNDGEVPQKKRGPGRPPANGIMSKREMRERKKAQEKAGLPDDGSIPQDDAATQKVKDGETAKVKKSTKKRKRADSSMDGKKGDDADGAEKETEKTESPKPPPPKKEDYTAEQLEPPKNQTYLTIIYGILRDIQPKAMSLQEIYEAVKNKYPHYRFGVETTGWESSIRHTVAQTKYFNKIEKGEKDGKGHRYCINMEHPAPQPRIRNNAPPPVQAPYRGPVNALPPGQYRQQQPYYPLPPGQMQANGMHPPPPYNLQQSMYAHNSMNPPRPLPGTYPQHYPPPNVGQRPPPLHLQHTGPNALPTRIPGQAPAAPQAPGLARPQGVPPNQQANGQQHPGIPTAPSRPISAQNATSVLGPQQSPAPPHQASPGLSNGPSPVANGPPQVRPTNTTPLSATSQHPPPARSPLPGPAPASNQIASSVSYQSLPTGQAQTTLPNQQQHMPPRETTQTPSRAQETPREPIQVTQLELFLSGSRPPFFDRTKRGFPKQDDQVACERAAVWMMDNTKKLQEYWRDKEAKDPHPEAPAEPKKVNSFVKILSSVLRTDHEEATQRRQSNHVDDQNRAGRPSEE